MSAEHHEGMAAREEAEATAHQERFDPSRGEERSRCRTSGGRVPESICWTSTVNPNREP